MVRLALSKTDELAQHHTFNWRVHLIKQTCIEMGHPILFSKAIIILAFMPIFTFQRVEGKIFSPMAFTLSFALLGAILLTLTLLPALLSYAVKNKDLAEKHSSLDASVCRSVIATCCCGRNTTASAIVCRLRRPACDNPVAGAPLLGSEFLPKLDEGNIWLTISLPPATALDETKNTRRQVFESIFAPIPRWVM